MIITRGFGICSSPLLGGFGETTIRGTIATNIKDQIESQIIDRVAGLGSTLTIYPVTETKDSYGEYAETTGSSKVISAVPFNYIKSSIGKYKFGTLSEGQIRLVISSDESFNNQDWFIWQSKVYTLEQQNGIPLQDTIVATILTLQEKIGTSPP